MTLRLALNDGIETGCMRSKKWVRWRTKFNDVTPFIGASKQPLLELGNEARLPG